MTVKRVRLKLNDRGVALMVCITIIAILMIFCFSLLAVAYSLYSSQNNNLQDDRNSEAAKSLAMAIREELTSGEEDSFLCKYLRYNIVAEEDALLDPLEVWPHYAAGEENHGEKDARRYFSLQKSDYADIKGFPSDISLCMWWTKPEEGDIDGKVNLFVEIESRAGSQSYVIRNRYELDTDNSTRSIYSKKSMQKSINPGEKTIDTHYVWHWTFVESE